MTYYIADSAVFIMGYEVESSLIITTPSVVNELKSREVSMRFEVIRESGARVEMPDPEMVDEVLRMAGVTKDNEELSTTDIEILAKALEYRDEALLLTDDYAVQNVAEMLKIDVKPVVQKKISDRIVWGKRCTGCRRKFDSGDDCPVCGSPLKKSRKRKV